MRCARFGVSPCPEVTCSDVFSPVRIYQTQLCGILSFQLQYCGTHHATPTVGTFSNHTTVTENAVNANADPFVQKSIASFSGFTVRKMQWVFSWVYCFLFYDRCYTYSSWVSCWVCIRTYCSQVSQWVESIFSKKLYMSQYPCLCKIMLIYCHWQTILQMSIETTYSGNHVQQGCTHLQQSLTLLKATLLCVLRTPNRTISTKWLLFIFTRKLHYLWASHWVNLFLLHVQCLLEKIMIYLLYIINSNRFSMNICGECLFNLEGSIKIEIEEHPIWLEIFTIVKLPQSN